MKNKKLILILIATITVIAAATVLSACDKNKGEFVDVGIELYSAKQYYVEGETFTPEGGILKVYSYNEKTKEEKYRFVDLTDKDVTLENTTGARVDTYTVTARYKGLATQFKYIVQKEENAVASVDFVLTENHGAPVYSVSDIRSEIDFSDFIGMKFVIKYRNTEKQDEEVPLWDETNYYFDKGINYTGFDVKTAGLKYITFTCIATDVVLPYKVTEDDFVYDFEFVKYDKEKKEYVSVKKEDSVRRNYLVGEKFDAQNTKIRYIYKSLKKTEPVDISESQISGFDTTNASDKKMFILSLLTGVETFNYSVFEETAVKGVTLNNKDFSQPTPGFNDVWTEKTKGEWKEYEEYIDAIKLCLVLNEDGKQYVPVTGADEDIILYYVTPDEQDLSLKKEFTKEVFDKLKKTECEYEIIAVYRKNPEAYARRIFFTVKNFITGIDFVNLNVDLVFTEGDAFSFGEATATVHYADGKTKTVRLQDEYEKADENTRLIRMKSMNAVEAKTFDMSAGEHKNQYYITANIDISDYEVTVNGEKFVEDNGFRIYISYVVQKDKGEFVDVGIELYSAKQYYVEGETFTPEGGILKVYSYNEKTKEEKYRFVDLTDKDVTLENTTGARVDTYTVTARYKGLATQFKYIVQKEENAVASVDFVLTENHGAPVYSVSDIRSEIDFSDFIGMKFVIKYRNTEKQDEEVPLWDETNYYFDKGINYTGFDVKTAGLKYITFTCIATDVVLPYKVTEDDFVYDFEFVKYDKEKKEYVSVKKEDSVRRNYLVGEKFDAQNTKIRYIYKSLKKTEPVDISESQISGFDTTNASDKKMFILSLLTGVETFNYSVFEETAVKGVTLNNKDFSQPTPGFNDVWTEKTKGEWKEYEEYIDAIKLCLVLNEDGKQYVPVTGADEDIILYYVTPDEQDLSLKKEFTKEVFDKLKKTECEYEIIAVYRKNPEAYARRIFFTVKNFITGIDFVNLNVDLVFTEGDAFSFGEATATVHYADGKTKTVRLQDEYEKADENTRLIRMKSMNAVEAKTFDMSAGEHKNQYYITANIDISDYEVTVNGEKFVEDNGFRIYISYVVQKA